MIPMGRVYYVIWLAGRPDVIFTTFGDMMRVPGSDGSPARGEGARLPTSGSCTRRSTR